MKKIFIFLFTVLYIFSLTGCTSSENEKEYVSKGEEMRAVWISYYEYDIQGLSYEQFKERINNMFDNVKNIGLNTVITHVRANADAIYRSEHFPFSDILTGTQGIDPGYDPLEYMVFAAHERGLELHAWINPYRVCNTSADITTLSTDHIARIWYENEETSKRVIPFGEKIYFNPAIPEVRQLITDGIREIINNYDVDGIHLDDYFYPTDAESFDTDTYNEYKSNSPSPLGLAEWRTTNISTLVSEIWKITKSSGIKLGISPSAHIEGDYLTQNGYADVESWLKTHVYADYIIPQIYWGFEYADKAYRFDNILSKWTKLKRHQNVSLCPGLAAYKIGTEDTNDEWLQNSDIIKRQIECLRDSGCEGFALFSYSYIFSSEEQHTLERQNLISLLNEKTAH